MRFYPTALLAALALTACAEDVQMQVAAPEAGFDAALARKLGADEYGMKSYVLVTLLTGPKDAQITDKTIRSKLFRGHFANMTRLADEGKLVTAGPIMEALPKRGLYVFNTDSLETARAWVETDPAVTAGIFTFEAEKFYSSAALQEIGRIHKTIARQKVE